MICSEPKRSGWSRHVRVAQSVRENICNFWTLCLRVQWSMFELGHRKSGRMCGVYAGTRNFFLELLELRMDGKVLRKTTMSTATVLSLRAKQSDGVEAAVS